MRHRITHWIGQNPTTVRPFWAIFASFATYFCMYAFRKPYSAASYEELSLLGGAVLLAGSYFDFARTADQSAVELGTAELETAVAEGTD